MLESFLTINPHGYIPPCRHVAQQTLAEYAERLRVHNPKAYSELQEELDEHFATAAAYAEFSRRCERAGITPPHILCEPLPW